MEEAGEQQRHRRGAADRGREEEPGLGEWRAEREQSPSGTITQQKATKKQPVVTQLSPSARVDWPSTTWLASNTIEIARIAMIGAARAISAGSAL